MSNRSPVKVTMVASIHLPKNSRERAIHTSLGTKARVNS
jgi:hypothetical protein